MKKIISLVIILIVSTALCGCGKSSNIDTSTSKPTSKIDISIFKEVEPSSENIDIYRKEVFSRLESFDESSNFSTDEEWAAIQLDWRGNLHQDSYYFTSFTSSYNESIKYYYPVVFRNGDSLVLWYTDEDGYVSQKGISGENYSNPSGHLHYNSDEKLEVISSKVDYTVTYSQESGKVTVWSFGDEFSTYDIPKNSVYCGFSYFEGYIFRNGTDVYSLKAIDTHNIDETVKCIAHNVEYVIDADYYYGSDPWCQPLFIMTDGSVKAYIGWEGNQDSPDSTSHLCDLQYEGSWDK